MTQVAQWGSMAMINHISGNVPPYIGTSAPTWVPGLSWINTTSGAVLYSWNGTTWVTGAGGRYIALCTVDPATTGPAGGYSVNISDLQEDTTSGYTRQPVTFTEATTAYPAVVSNSSNLVFGPYSAAQATPVQWAAMVTAASGTSGLLLFWWDLSQPWQVAVSQSITIGTGTLTYDQQ